MWSSELRCGDVFAEQFVVEMTCTNFSGPNESVVDLGSGVSFEVFVIVGKMSSLSNKICVF